MFHNTRGVVKGYVIASDFVVDDKTCMAWSPVGPNIDRNEVPIHKLHVPFWAKASCDLVHGP